MQRITRFVGPFPDVKITDLTTVVDGKTAVIRFVTTGMQKGDLDLGGGNAIKATNKPIHLDGAEIFTFDETES